MEITQEILDNSPGGIHCRFVDLGDCGMKIYLEKQARDVQFRNQLALCSRGFAPECWDCVEFDGPDGNLLYAFYTEKVEVFDRSKYDELLNNSYLQAESYQNYWVGKAIELSRALEEDDIDWGDDHPGNVGIDCSGNTVLIDCDFLFDESGDFALAGFGCKERWPSGVDNR